MQKGVRTDIVGSESELRLKILPVVGETLFSGWNACLGKDQSLQGTNRVGRADGGCDCFSGESLDEYLKLLRCVRARRVGCRCCERFGERDCLFVS